ncbi:MULTISPECIES: DUF3088 domain-containing protein [Agrobacterium]|uniref:DUF3088 domain-containing protein n=1 Tax=Agrobacterium rosae TaxID=1972867 RepID=A0A1R3U282_9HYPH|nr:MULTISPECIES: DUF3088 domain-containing protein [Agrobacterium]SCX22443.1 hypothetical protein DSM25558_3144 [Agrobacterium sp. DSM 25558]SCX35364.1 hypothetical protein DSM25559_4923 [Agrobacterium rosae]
MKDELFILRPGFGIDEGGPFYCGDAVAVEGVLSFFPELRDKIAVQYIEAPRPRAEIIEKIGADNQSAPVLILSESTVPVDSAIAFKTFGSVRFIDQPGDICRYLSAQYGVARAA